MEADWGPSSSSERSYRASGPTSYSMEEFDVYKTQRSFYLIGCSTSRAQWRVLEIERSEPSALKVNEDPTVYTEQERDEYLQRLADQNGGVEFVTKAYGIVGFVKFKEPYYMVLITGRRLLGNIQGHPIYEISKSLLVTVPNLAKATHSDAENRYIRLFNSVNLSKDFFYSYTYRVMWNLQRVMSNKQLESMPYDDMFVWNSFISRQFRNEVWTVALVYGFFNQVKVTWNNINFVLTLIARRSRHFAGTRYFKRGVDQKGRVANDVETEQIVHEEKTEQISSIVQHRGSIPLCWSQEISVFDPKPDINLHENGPAYHATKLHFQNLVERYKNRIFVLNLVKTMESKPRESILSKEFKTAVDCLNKTLHKNEKIKFLPCDMNLISTGKDTHRKDMGLSEELKSRALRVLDSTGFYYSSKATEKHSQHDLTRFSGDALNGSRSHVVDDQHHANQRVQCGVLRTNCIDCIDRTNVAQYAFGLAALGRQLKEMGLYNSDEIDPTSRLAIILMEKYRNMGDVLALQYGGSSAHSRFFSQWQGQWSITIQTMTFIRSVVRHYSNTLLDGEKQDAINIFLGQFRPQVGKPEIWELESSSQLQIRKAGHGSMHDLSVPLKRTLSETMQRQDVIPPALTPDVFPANSVKEMTSIRRVTLNPSMRGITISEAELRKCLEAAGGLESIVINRPPSQDHPVSVTPEKIADILENPSGDYIDAGNSSEDEAQEKYLITNGCAYSDDGVSSDIVDQGLDDDNKDKGKDDDFQDLTTLLMEVKYKRRETSSKMEIGASLCSKLKHWMVINCCIS